MADIKTLVTDLVNFDVETSIQDEEAVEKLVNTFKDIVESGDEVAITFIQNVLVAAKEKAVELELIDSGEEAVADEPETTDEPTEPETEEAQEDEATPEEESVQEGTAFSAYEDLKTRNIDAIGMANRFMSDIE